MLSNKGNVRVLRHRFPRFAVELAMIRKQPQKVDKSTQEPPSVVPVVAEVLPERLLDGPTPIQSSTGIYSKREMSPTHPTFELKLNVIESEIVVLENSSHVDTNAVIFKVPYLHIRLDYECKDGRYSFSAYFMTIRFTSHL